MANLTSVGVTSGVPTSGTGTVSTIDNLPNLTLTVASHAVTNAGTFAVQNTAATPAGTNVIGHVIADTGSTTAVTSLPAIPAGTNVIGHVIVDTAPTTAVTGTFFQATQPVSATSLPLPTGAATSALQPTAAAIGSTTSGQTGHVVLGATTTAAPTYTTAQSNPLSLDTAGNLRVNVVTGGTSGVVAQGSTTSGQTGMMVQGAVTTAAPTYTTAQTSPLSLDTTGALRVNVTAGGAGGGIVTNAGTFAVQNTTATPAGTNTIGSVKVTDGTNTAAVKAASTAPSTTDPAIVVAISPNSVNANGSATSANSAPVVIASDQVAIAVKGNAANGSAVSGNPILIAGSDGTNARSLATDTSGRQVAVGAGTAGTATGGVLTVQGVASMTPVIVSQATAANLNSTVVNAGTFATQSSPTAAATGGASNLHFFSVTGTPTATSIKSSAGTLYGIQAINTGAAPVYLKLYNTASGSVTVGTTTPVMTIAVPTVATTGAGIVVPFPVGVAFSTAISYAITNVAADNDATAVAVGVTANVQFA